MSVAWSSETGSLDFTTLRRLYHARKLWPRDLITTIFRRIRDVDAPNTWITLLDEQAVFDRAKSLEESVHPNSFTSLPLFGIPFAVKDNIDVAGLPTTAACREFKYVATVSSPVVDMLLKAGAILIGKTNLDQFACGLTGLLSSYGATRNPFNPDYISGGSSSGSAVAVAAGLVSFALGTDTAGSGRVPAGFNHLVGLKPTRGMLSTRGVVPACRSLDCLSFLTLNVNDASELLSLTKAFDPLDPYSRKESTGVDLSVLTFPVSTFRFGVPQRSQLEFFGDAAAAALYDRAIERLERIGGTRIEIDASSFLETGKLLYMGPWIAERLASVKGFFASHSDAFHPITQHILDRGHDYSGVDAFSAGHQLESLRRRAEDQWALMDLLLLPTTGTAVTIADASVDPVAASAKLGLYTNFVNLLNLCAVALPAGFAQGGVPLGITLMAPAFSEANLLAVSRRFFPDRRGGLHGAAHPELCDPLSSTESSSTEPERRTLICVVGAHLAGQPLNHQLTELDGRLVRRCKTASSYRLFALKGTTPPKPGLVRTSSDDKALYAGTSSHKGTAINVEIWSLPDSNVAAFLARIPSPLCLGNIQLDNGESVKGFLCEPLAIADATDISHFGGWTHYLASIADSRRNTPAHFPVSQGESSAKEFSP